MITSQTLIFYILLSFIKCPGRRNQIDEENKEKRYENKTLQLKDVVIFSPWRSTGLNSYADVLKIFLSV